ncbi:hypothetical protein VZT92_017476 [Zoarces viviparus]|uniref:Uncharacterized protein n=1 Tax=Zoarces viviparus TaxID=48416 RepID=A0AAW1ERY9_ZOAVI
MNRLLGCDVIKLNDHCQTEMLLREVRSKQDTCLNADRVLRTPDPCCPSTAVSGGATCARHRLMFAVSCAAGDHFVSSPASDAPAPPVDLCRVTTDHNNEGLNCVTCR